MGGLGLAFGIGSSIGSAVNARQAADEQRKKQGMIEQEAAEDKALFNKQYYQDITKRTDVQNMLRILNENQRKADTRAEAQAAITGATPEQKLAAREVNRRTYADAVADIASNASQIRDQYLRDYQNQRNRTWQQRLGMQDQLAAIHSNTAGQWANAASNAFTAGAALLGTGINGLAGREKFVNPTVPMDKLKPEAGVGSTYIQSPAAADAGKVLNNISFGFPDLNSPVNPLFASK